MPAPEPAQSAGWIAAAIVGGGSVIAGLSGAFGALLNGWWTRKTAVENKKIDSKDAYADDVREDLDKLTTRFEAQQATIASMIAQRDLDGLAAVERERKMGLAEVSHEAQIAHLNNVVEQLQFEVERLKGQKAEYEAMIVQKDGVIAQRDALVVHLQEQLANMGIIGVGETAPPKRLKTVEGGE